MSKPKEKPHFFILSGYPGVFVFIKNSKNVLLKPYLSQFLHRYGQLVDGGCSFHNLFKTWIPSDFSGTARFIQISRLMMEENLSSCCKLELTLTSLLKFHENLPPLIQRRAKESLIQFWTRIFSNTEQVQTHLRIQSKRKSNQMRSALLGCHCASQSRTISPLFEKHGGPSTALDSGCGSGRGRRRVTFHVSHPGWLSARQRCWPAVGPSTSITPRSPSRIQQGPTLAGVGRFGRSDEAHPFSRPTPFNLGMSLKLHDWCSITTLRSSKAIKPSSSGPLNEGFAPSFTT